jgi:hypothetical protein
MNDVIFYFYSIRKDITALVKQVYEQKLTVWSE